MKFGKYTFDSFEQFQSVSNLAIANGVETMLEFTKFLNQYYS